MTAASGIHFRHTSGRSGRFYLPETLGAGCAFLDYNDDGRLDLFLVNSSRLPGSSARGPFFPALYRNDGSGRFTDVTQQAGLAVECYGLGVSIADYDADGFPDLYLTGMGSNHLFHNNGDGTFADVTRQARVGGAHFSTSAAWLDYDRDGDLDLFVCNYCRWSPTLNQVCPDALGRKHLCGPTYYEGEPSTLYRNNGDGTFTDVTRQAGLADTVGKALGVVVCDPDDDGRLDLIVAKDMEPNLFYRGNGDGTFTERGVEAGIAYSSRGETRAGMGIDTADTTRTGRESVAVGNNSGQGLAQFLLDPDTTGAVHFTDAAETTGLYRSSLPFATFGLVFVDYDNDAYPDLITANGHIDENVAAGSSVTFTQSLGAFHNSSDGHFVPVGAALGPIFEEKRLWRGLAVGDIDGDGDADLLVSACDGRPALLRNDGGNANAWLQVKAIAAGRNRDAIGAHITVTANGMRQSGWIRSGSSYCSQHELIAFFGLGAATQADTIDVRFPSGAHQILRGVKARQRIVVDEKKGLQAQARRATSS
jgi:enediyne biosynthesis protein E4